MNTLYTLGYATWSTEDVNEKAEVLDALVIDVRLKPHSSKPGFSKDALHYWLGRRYLHVPQLGNVNYSSGDPKAVEIADFENGRRRLRSVPTECGFRPEAIILMCGCKDPSRCHRSEVAERLAGSAGMDVVHLASPGKGSQQGLFDA